MGEGDEEIPQKSTEQLLSEEVLNNLDSAINNFLENKSGEGKLVSQAAAVWEKAMQNQELSKAIEEALRQRRKALTQGFGALNIAKHGDPVRNRYDPNTWMDTVPPEFEGREADYFLDRVHSLRAFLSGLSL